jgi:hypothetical protein
MGGAGYLMSKRAGRSRRPRWRRRKRRRRAAAAAEQEEASWQDVMPVDTLGLEVGYRLIPLVDKTQGGELLKRIKGIRKKFAQEVGFLAPPVHIRDNLELKPSAYRIALKGVEVGTGEAYNGQFWRSIRAWPAAPARHGDHRSGLRPAGGVDRRQPARPGAGHGLHRGRCRHRGGDPPESPDHHARVRTAGPRRGAACWIT